MRILMVTDFYPPIIGGLELHVQRLSRALVRQGHDVAVATLRHDGLSAFERDGEIRIYHMGGVVQRLPGLFSDAGRRFAPPLPDPEAAAKLAGIVRRERPDIVHGHNWLLYSYLPVRRIHRSPVAMTLHDYGLVCARKTLLTDQGPCAGPGARSCTQCSVRHYGLVRGLATAASLQVVPPAVRSLVDMFLPVSEAVARGSGLAGGSVPYTVVPNFVTPLTGKHADGSSRLSELLPRGEYILYVGRFTRAKGIDVLLRAHAQLPNPPALVLVGPDHGELPDALPTGVTVLTNLDNADVMEAWRRATVGVVPSLWPEPCPTVAIEALFAGTPLVASRLGGLPEVVGDAGLLVTPGDAAELASALARLLADPSLRGSLAESGMRRAQDFSEDMVVPRIEAIYRRLQWRSLEEAA